MSTAKKEKFELRLNDSGWEIIGISDNWAIKGYKLFKVGKYFYVSAPQEEKLPVVKGTVFRVLAVDVAATVHNLWVIGDFKPTKNDLKPETILRSLDVNYEAIRQLWIHRFWDLRNRKRNRN